MSKFTPEAYAESARKYGITQGPWHVFTNRHPSTNGESWGCVETQRHPAGGAGVGIPGTNGLYWSGDEGRKYAAKIASLPNLLIERDALKAENERLRKALETLRNLHTDAVFVCGVDDEQRAHEALMSADAALNGGAA